jgi:hypothetical protein
MGFDRHWVMDDNIQGFYRLHMNHRYKVVDAERKWIIYLV